MDPSVFLPPEIGIWLLRYGIFVLACVAAALVVVLLFRPVALWYTGRSELLDRLKRVEETQRKALLELELLNKTLSIPLKRAEKKVPAEPEPIVVSQETKEDFLKALEKTRRTLGRGRDQEE